MSTISTVAGSKSDNESLHSFRFRGTNEKVYIHPKYQENKQLPRDLDSTEYKMKRLASEVVTSYSRDLLDKKKIKLYRKKISMKISKQTKGLYRFLIQRHENALDWFENEATESIWYDLLGWDKLDKVRINKLISKKTK